MGVRCTDQGLAIEARAIDRCPLRGPGSAEPFCTAGGLAVRPLAEHVDRLEFNSTTGVADCGRLLAPKIAGPEARAARERPPLRGLENVQSPVSATRTGIA